MRKRIAGNARNAFRYRNAGNTGTVKRIFTDLPDGAGQNNRLKSAVAGKSVWTDIHRTLTDTQRRQRTFIAVRGLSDIDNTQRLVIKPLGAFHDCSSGFYDAARKIDRGK